jgi:hypothetical protein
METLRWKDRINTVRRKNNVWRLWFKERVRWGEENWKRFNTAVKCMIKFGRRCEKFVLGLQEDYKGNKKLLHTVIRNKMKPKTELCSTLDRIRTLVWTQDAYLRTWMEHFMGLLNGQMDSEDITENNYTTEDTNIPDKIEVNMLDLETAVRPMKNKSPRSDELTTDMIKAAGPIGT